MSPQLFDQADSTDFRHTTQTFPREQQRYESQETKQKQEAYPPERSIC